MTRPILVVDDEPDAIDLFRQLFRREIRNGAIDIRFATSAAEALALLDAIGSDEDSILVLCDINMPGMSGLELLREIRARWQRLPVVVVTAYGDAENRRRAFDNGASGFVTKPVDFATLKAALDGQRASGQA